MQGFTTMNLGSNYYDEFKILTNSQNAYIIGRWQQSWESKIMKRYLLWEITVKL